MTDGTPALKKPIPAWEKVVWLMIALFLLIAFFIFWWLGWSRLQFPL